MFSYLGIVLNRMLFSLVCGGLIGIEREYRRRSAGFRTHILICLGSSITALTGQYLGLCAGMTTDITRLAAQVVSGIGFVGAGAIIITQQYRVKGLTTAAGLWTTAIIGLSFGVGFYSAGIMATVLILVAEVWLTKLEYYLLEKSSVVTFFIEYRYSATVSEIISLLKGYDVKILDLKFSKRVTGKDILCLVASVDLNKEISSKHLIIELNKMENVKYVEEL